MKKLVLLLLCLGLLAALSACGCDHQWTEADCKAPKTCALCAKTQGEALAHHWQEAACETPRTCTLCGHTEGEPNGHVWKDATCIALQECTLCGKTQGDYAEHRFTEVSCTDPGYCELCGEKGTERKDHDLTQATCMSLAACRNCGESFGYLGDHVFQVKEDQTMGPCTLCGYVLGGDFLPHELFFGNTCAPLIGTWTAQWQAGGDSVGLKKADASIRIQAEVTVCFTNYGKFTMTVVFDKTSYLEALAAYNAAGDANETAVADGELVRSYTGTYYWYADALCGFDGEDAVLIGTVMTKVEQEFTVDTDSMGKLTFVKQN